jgi:hypothetical protein
MKEAMCYGPLHPRGKRLGEESFAPDPDRINNLAEYCIACAHIIANRKKTVRNQPQQKEPPMSEQKTCIKCGQTKDIKEFSLQSGRKTKRRGQCKACNRAYQAQYKARKTGRKPAAIKPAKPAAPEPARPAAPEPQPAKSQAPVPKPSADPARILEILRAAGIVRPEQIAEAAAFIERLHHAA